MTRAVSHTVSQRRLAAPVLSLLLHACVGVGALWMAGTVVRHPPEFLVTEITLAPAEIHSRPDSPQLQSDVEPWAPPASAPARPSTAEAAAVPTPSKRGAAPKPVPQALPQPAAPQPVSARPAEDVMPETAGNAAPVAPSVSTAVSAGPGQAIASPPSVPEYRMGTADTPAPSYPPQARRRGRQGAVLVHLDVSPEGLVEHARVAESSGDQSLDEAALTTLSRWRLRPALENGYPVWGKVLVPVRFRLE